MVGTDRFCPLALPPTVFSVNAGASVFAGAVEVFLPEGFINGVHVKRQMKTYPCGDLASQRPETSRACQRSARCPWIEPSVGT